LTSAIAARRYNTGKMQQYNHWPWREVASHQAALSRDVQSPFKRNSFILRPCVGPYIKVNTLGTKKSSVLDENPNSHRVNYTLSYLQITTRCLAGKSNNLLLLMVNCYVCFRTTLWCFYCHWWWWRLLLFWAYFFRHYHPPRRYVSRVGLFSVTMNLQCARFSRTSNGSAKIALIAAH